MDERPVDEVAAAAKTLRSLYHYVSAADELRNPDSTINQAEDDEPVFVLRARDVVATVTIGWWIWCARHRGVPDEKLARAENQLHAVEMWLDKRLPAHGSDVPPAPVHTAASERRDSGSVLHRAHPDEPVFVIVASDAVAVQVVEFWAFMAERNGAAASKVEGAMEVARAMARWSRKRLVGVQRRAAAEGSGDGGGPSHARLKPVREGALQHKTVSHVACSHCGYTEKIGEPPYTPELMATIADACRGPCPGCGAVEEVDSATGTRKPPLTIIMVKPGETPQP